MIQTTALRWASAKKKIEFTLFQLFGEQIHTKTAQVRRKKWRMASKKRRKHIVEMEFSHR